MLDDNDETEETTPFSIDELKRVGFGLLNLTPENFWNLTPAQLYELIEGYNIRFEEKRLLIAWHMAGTMNVHLKRKDQVTINQLLGKFRKMNTIEMEENIDKAISYFEKKRENEDIREYNEFGEDITY